MFWVNSESNWAPTRALPMSTTGGRPAMTYFSWAAAWVAPAILAFTRTILSADTITPPCSTCGGGVGDIKANHVGADREAGEVVFALVVGQRRVFTLRALEDDGDAPERHVGVLVGDTSRDTARDLLRTRDPSRHEQQRHPHGECCTTTNAVHLTSLSLHRWVHRFALGRYGAVKVVGGGCGHRLTDEVRGRGVDGDDDRRPRRPCACSSASR